eukprot:4624932-Lingulodinium_polyedra.AAC.1
MRRSARRRTATGGNARRRMRSAFGPTLTNGSSRSRDREQRPTATRGNGRSRAATATNSNGR